MARNMFKLKFWDGLSVKLRGVALIRFPFSGATRLVIRDTVKMRIVAAGGQLICSQINRYDDLRSIKSVVQNKK